MTPRSDKGRKLLDLAVKIISLCAALLGIFFLGWILLVVVQKGIAAINWHFFTELPTPPGMEGGGVKNAILGTVLMTLLATLLGVPSGILAGVYLAEFGKHSRFGAWVRFTVNVLMGIPSIIIGLFVYSALVFPFGHFSGFAGGVFHFSAVAAAEINRKHSTIRSMV